MSESLKDKIIKLLSAFREPMCRRLCDDPTCACRREAGAAIALVVDEAARVALEVEALVAERDRLKRHLDIAMQTIGKVEAHRDRLKAALTASAPQAPHSHEAAETQPRPPTPEPARG
jgi:hypothetical protein